MVVCRQQEQQSERQSNVGALGNVLVRHFTLWEHTRPHTVTKNSKYTSWLDSKPATIHLKTDEKSCSCYQYISNYCVLLLRVHLRSVLRWGWRWVWCACGSRWRWRRPVAEWSRTGSGTTWSTASGRNSGEQRKRWHHIKQHVLQHMDILLLDMYQYHQILQYFDDKSVLWAYDAFKQKIFPQKVFSFQRQ